jgi:uncharacterized coiled-coil protein SlyX
VINYISLQLSKLKRRLADEEAEKHACQSRIAVLETDVAAARAEITSLRAAVAAQDGSLSQLQARVCGLEQQLQVRPSLPNHFVTAIEFLTIFFRVAVQSRGQCVQSFSHSTGSPAMPLLRVTR